VRYWMASLRWRGSMFSEASRSAMVLRGLRKHLLGVNYDGLERFRSVHQIDGLRQRLKSKYVDALDYGRFASIRFGNGERLQSRFSRGKCSRKRTTYRANASIER
jgi:hypothetical protein